MGKKKDDGDVPEFQPAQLKNVQTQLKKLEKNLLKLILGHDQVLHGYFDKVAKKNGLPAVFILGNLLSVVAHCLTPGSIAPASSVASHILTCRRLAPPASQPRRPTGRRTTSRSSCTASTSSCTSASLALASRRCAVHLPSQRLPKARPRHVPRRQARNLINRAKSKCSRLSSGSARLPPRLSSPAGTFGSGRLRKRGASCGRQAASLKLARPDP